MKKLYMCTIIGSSGKGCVLIILFQLYESNAGLFQSNYPGCVNNPPSTLILEEELILY